MYKKLLESSDKELFKVMGLTLIIVPFLMQNSNYQNYIFGFDVSLFMKILTLLLFLIGIFYLILIDTSFFRIKPLDALINKDISEFVFRELDIQLETELKQRNNTILYKNTQHKSSGGKFILKPIKQIVDIIENLEADLFPHNPKIDIVKIFTNDISSTKIKIPLNIKSNKNIVKVLPIFDFFR